MDISVKITYDDLGEEQLGWTLASSSITTHRSRHLYTATYTNMTSSGLQLKWCT